MLHPARLPDLLLLASLLSPAVTATAGEDAAPPTYDATGDWVLHIEGPHLLSGDCEVMEEPGYEESVHIEQDRADFIISTADGQIERGTISGEVYTHSALQRGTDVTGMFFELETRSTFTLTSPDASVGKTILDLRFEDGSECLLDLRFEGQRVERDSSHPGTHRGSLHSA